MRELTFWPLLAFAASCSARPPPVPETGPYGGVAAPKTCRVVLPPRDAAPAPAALPADPVPPEDSRLVVIAEASLARLRAELEKRVDRRLAEVRGADAGVAGLVNYTVERGPLSLSVDSDALLVRADIQADAEICARGRCYASCKPTAIAEARVPLKLTDDYRFAPPRVTVTFTRGCKIRALAGFLTIDVTPTLETLIEPRLRRVEREIERQQPELRTEAERAWVELSRSRKIPLLGCLVPRARGIAQGPVEAADGMLRLLFAVRAAPELRPECDEAPSAQPLPRLEHEPNVGHDAKLSFAFVSPLSAIASAFETMPPVEMDGARLSVAKASVSPRGRALEADLALTGDVCGDLCLSALPEWDSRGGSLALTASELCSGEAQRLEARSLRGAPLARALTRAPRLEVPVDISKMREVVPSLVASLSTNEAVDVGVTLSEVRPAGASVRGKELVATVAVFGSVVLREKR